MFHGKANIFGFDALDAFIQVQPTTIIVNIKLGPINIGGDAFSLRASEKDEKNGPSVEINISKSKATFKIKAWLRISLFAVGVDFDVTTEHISVTTRVKLVKMFEAEAIFMAGYHKGLALKNAGFSVSTLSTHKS